VEPIDVRRSRKAQAKEELRAACSTARDVLEQAGLTADQVARQAADAVGAAVPFHRTEVARLRPNASTHTSEWRVPVDGLCRAIDALCAKRGLGPFHLAELRAKLGLASDEVAHPRRDERYSMRVGLPPGAHTMQSRDDLLTVIDPHPAGSPPVLRQVATGDGGMGKSMLARQVWDRSVDAGRPVLVWVVASSRPSIMATFASAARIARIDGLTSDNVETDATRFLAWLASTALPWLVILDDVRDPGDMVGLWPPAVADGRTLITTRRRDLRPPGPASVISVGTYSVIEAGHYLRTRITTDPRARIDALDGSDRLISELQFHPLALAQAAAYVLRAGTTCREYVALFHRRGVDVRNLFPDIDAADEYAFTVVTAWSIAQDAADAIEPLGLARPALALASMLDPDGIPEGVWTGLAGRNFLTAHRPEPHPAPDYFDFRAVVSANQARQALRNLDLLSIISHDPNPEHASTAVRVHAIVQRSMSDQLAGDDMTDTAWAAADALVALWPEHRHEPDLVRNAQTLMQNRPGAVILPEDGIHPVLTWAGTSLGRHGGQVKAARRHFDSLLAHSIEYLGQDHRHALVTRGNLAHFRGQAGDAAGAAADLTELIPDLIRVLGPDSNETLAARGNLAEFRGRAGDLAGAADECERLLSDQLRVLGPDDPHTLTNRAYFANFRGEAGDPVTAATAYEALLPDLSRVLGPKHPTTLAARGKLAEFRSQTGRWSDAAVEYGELLADQVALLGPDHPDTLITRADIARLLGRAQDFAGAVAAFESLVDDQRRVVGPDHPQTLTSRGYLAHFRDRAGDPAGAADEYDELVIDLIRTLGPDHPQTLAARANLAETFGHAGLLARALGVFRELLPDLERAFGPDHRQTLLARAHLADLLAAADDPLEAHAAYTSLLPDLIRTLGEDHPHVLTTRISLADLEHRNGNPVGAANALARVMPDLIRVQGPDHPQTLEARAGIAALRARTVEPAEIVPDLVELVADHVRVFGENDPRTVAVRNGLASVRDQSVRPPGGMDGSSA
jgi:hypothetical protein